LDQRKSPITCAAHGTLSRLTYGVTGVHDSVRGDWKTLSPGVGKARVAYIPREKLPFPRRTNNARVFLSELRVLKSSTNIDFNENKDVVVVDVTFRCLATGTKPPA
jgi:hypothetical protein